MIWDAELKKVKAQSKVSFDEERKAYVSCQHACNEIDMFGLPEKEEYIQGIDT